MRISELFQNTSCRLIGDDCEITSIQCDSRRVEPGCLFVCVVGTFQDGHQYAEKAAQAGAAALLVQRELPIDLPQVILPDTRIAIA